MKILAADDDASMTELYSAMLQEAGYEVQTAPDADAAMELYYAGKPDLLILDADMPGGGGERVFTIARKILAGGVPVIFVTGMPDKVSHFALTQPKVRVFSKPVDAEELLGAIKSLLPR